jgi:hypothetical protein
LTPFPEPNHFILIFMDTDVRWSEEPMQLLLPSDELGRSSAKDKARREKGVHVLTTWTWSRAGKRVSFWMRGDVTSSMRGKDWAVAIFRTDSWIEQSPMHKVDEIEDLGATWVDE